jgi:hypothetical protein
MPFSEAFVLAAMAATVFAPEPIVLKMSSSIAERKAEDCW